VLYDWKCEIESGKIVLTVTLDFKRAFETLDRNILLQKMKRYGIRGNELIWFK
jgi:hypothetical protein